MGVEGICWGDITVTVVSLVAAERGRHSRDDGQPPVLDELTV